MKICIANLQLVWMNAVAYFMAGLWLVGCSTSRDIGSEIYSNFDPAKIMASLPNEELVVINAYRTNVSAQYATKFAGDQEAESSYSEWYKTGYAYAYVKRSHWLRPQLYRKNEHSESRSETAKHDGWFNGNDDGFLERQTRDLKFNFESLPEPYRLPPKEE